LFAQRTAHIVFRFMKRVKKKKVKEKVVVSVSAEKFVEAASMLEPLDMFSPWGCCEAFSDMFNDADEVTRYKNVLAHYFLPDDGNPLDFWWDIPEEVANMNATFDQTPRVIALLLCAEMVETEKEEIHKLLND